MSIYTNKEVISLVYSYVLNGGGWTIVFNNKSNNSYTYTLSYYTSPLLIKITFDPDNSEFNAELDRSIFNDYIIPSDGTV